MSTSLLTSEVRGTDASAFALRPRIRWVAAVEWGQPNAAEDFAASLGDANAHFVLMEPLVELRASDELLRKLAAEYKAAAPSTAAGDAVIDDDEYPTA